MGIARCVLPNRTYMITRRCVGRRFLLVPDRVINGLFVYCLVRAAKTHGIKLHALCVMSNHYHLVMTDVHGVTPKFFHDFHLSLAKCVKTYRKWGGVVWEPSAQTTATELVNSAAVWNKLVYVLANPVTAGLVPKASAWPGVRTLPESRILTAVHPGLEFPISSSKPVRSQLSIPPAIKHWRRPDYEAHLHERLDAREQEVAEEMRAAKRRFLGVTRIKKTRHTDAPRTEMQSGRLQPHFAAVTREESIAAAEALVTFRQAYRDALDAFRSWQHDVKFPPGTWWMRVHLGCRCHPPPDAI